MHGYTYFIFGTEMNNSCSFHIVGCVMYSADQHGIYVNWMAISQDKYDNIRYGSMSPNIPFRRLGLGSFLLQLVQMKSAAMDWSIDMYLQANQGSEAVSFYKKISFEKMDTNNHTELPSSWFDPECLMYVKFVTDAINRREAEH